MSYLYLPPSPGPRRPGPTRPSSSAYVLTPAPSHIYITPAPAPAPAPLPLSSPSSPQSPPLPQSPLLLSLLLLPLTLLLLLIILLLSTQPLSSRPPSPPLPWPDSREELIQSLFFQGISYWQDRIRDAHEGTFKLASPPFTAGNEQPGAYGGFAQWLASGNGVFWVSGEPGSGKSTFMKHISQDPHTSRLLESWSGGKPCVILSYFFWRSGHRLQNSLEGLLRTLIFQILSHNRELVTIAFPSEINMETGDIKNKEWGIGELVTALKNITEDDDAPFRICIFIDGLDEYEDEYSDLLELIQLMSLLPSSKLCVASRPWNMFENAFGQTSRYIRLEDFTKDDIFNYTRDTLRRCGYPSELIIDTPSNSQNVAEKVTSKSQGAFLWATLAVNSLVESFARGNSLQYLQTLIDELPDDFNKLYERTLESIELFDAESVGSRRGSISRLPVKIMEGDQRQAAEEHLDKFLEDIQGRYSSGEDQIPPLSTDTTVFLEERYDSEYGEEERHDTDYNEEEINDTLAQVKEFLESGSPLQNLRKRLRTFAEPLKNKGRQHTGYSSHQADAESPPPPDQSTRKSELATSTYIGRTDNQEGFQSLPILIDRIFDLIPSQEPPIPKGKKRARWICQCGTRLFDDFVELQPGMVENLEAELQQRASGGRFEALKQVGKLLTIAIKTWITFNFVGKRLSTSNITSTPLPLHSMNAQTNPAIPPNGGNLHLLLCVEKGDFQTKLHQKIIDGYSNDREIFRVLHKEYHKYREFRTWFTLRGISRLCLTRASTSQFTVDLGGFAEAHTHAKACDSSCVCLPPKDRIDVEYFCDPAPKTNPGYVPAIGSARLTHYFRNPECVNDKQTTIYTQLPKRIVGELSASETKEELGWGIHFQAGWHWRTIYVILVVFIFSFSLIFGIAWSVSKADVQGAFAISGFWLTLGGVFIGYLAIQGS